MAIAAASAQPRHHLLKILGVTFGVAVAIGQIIGSGILRSPSVVAGELQGLGLIVGLWVLGAIQVSLAANLLSELATALPRTGGGYNYAHRALGDVGGLVVGWTSWLSNLAGAAAASVSFAEFLPLLVPSAGAHKIAAALSLQVALYAANLAGLREGRAVQELTSFAKAALPLVFIIAAVIVVAPAEPQTFLSSPAAFKWANVILAYQLIMGAYAGWDTPAVFAGENIDPAKAMPRALFYGILLTAFRYVGVNWALLHALSPAGVAASPHPFSVVLSRIGGSWPGTLFAIGATITVASCSNACIMAAPRILFALGSDRAAARLHQCECRRQPGHRLSDDGHRHAGACRDGHICFGLRTHRHTERGERISGGYFLLGAAKEGAGFAAAVPRHRLSRAADDSRACRWLTGGAVHRRQLHRRACRAGTWSVVHPVCIRGPSRPQGCRWLSALAGAGLAR
jgi:APA family basic amino acid/polyamine antiporter